MSGNLMSSLSFCSSFSERVYLAASGCETCWRRLQELTASVICRLDGLKLRKLLAGIQIGFETINSQLHISGNSQKKGRKRLARPEGFEPPTLCLEGVEGKL